MPNKCVDSQRSHTCKKKPRTTIIILRKELNKLLIPTDVTDSKDLRSYTVKRMLNDSCAPFLCMRFLIGNTTVWRPW